MLNFSQIISLPLINLYDMKIEGYIENILIDPDRKRLSELVVYNENDDLYYIVKYSDVYKVGQDCVYITNSSKITPYENLELSTKNNINPLNAQCYNISGTNLGKITEITFNYGQLHSITINNKSYPTTSICGITNNLIIVSEKKINLKRFGQVRRISRDLNNFANQNQDPVVTILNNTNIAPTRAITNYNFLLNRLIMKDIKNQSGEVIANKNTLITANIIQKLKYYGKIKELILNSRNY